MVGFDFYEMVVALGFFVFVGCWVFLECSWTIEWNSRSNIYSFQLHTVSYHLKNHAISIANILLFSTRVFLSKSFTILTNLLLDLYFLCFFFNGEITEVGYGILTELTFSGQSVNF